MRGTATGVATCLGGMVVAAASALAQPQPQPQPRVPIADFVRKGQYEVPQLAPDGKHLVVTVHVQNDGRDESLIVVYDLAEMKVASRLRMPKFETAGAYRWISNTRLIVMTAREFGSLEGPQFTGDMFAVDFDGGKRTHLYGSSNRGIGTLAAVPDALDGHFLLNENPWDKRRPSRLYDVNSLDGQRSLVAEFPLPGFRFLTQRDGTPRFAYSGETALKQAAFRFDFKKREWQLFSNAALGDLLPLSMSPDGAAVLGQLSLGQGPRSLVTQALEGEQRVTLADDKIGDIDRLEWGPRHDAPFAASTEVGRPSVRYLDDGADTHLHKLLAAQFPGSYVHFLSFSRDGAKLLFSVVSDRDPGAYYLFDRSAGKAALLFARMPWIEPERMGERRPIHFKASDGVELHGYLTLPADRGDDKLPLVLLPHGGPYRVNDTWFFDTNAQFLASRGYAVLQINYRGSGGRGPGFEEAGLRQWGGRIQDDLIDGVRWIVEQGTVDPARICTYGASFGAYSSMMSAIRAPGLFKCAIGFAGVYDLPSLYDEYETRADVRLRDYWIAAIGQDPAELAANSPARQADKLTLPVLLIHGGADTRALPEHADKMRAALKKAGRPPEWFYVSDEGHGFYAAANRQALYEKLEAFLAKHIGK